MVDRVVATEICLNAIEALRREHGELLFYQSHGCCDGSTPMCYTTREFEVGPHNVLLGHLADVPFYVSKLQYEYLKHSQLIIDLGAGGSDTFSLRAPDGRGFLMRSRLFSDEEWAQLLAEAPEGLTP